MADDFFKEIMNNIAKIGSGEHSQETNKVQGVSKDISIFALNDSSQADTMNEIFGFLGKNEDFGMFQDEKDKLEKEMYDNLAYYDYGDFDIMSDA